MSTLITLAASVFCFVLVACSSSEEAAGPCAARTGNYKVSYVEQSGSCGRITDGVENMDSPGTSSSCVYAKNQQSADRCKLDTDFTCEIPGFKSRTVSTCTFSRDGASGTCTATVDAVDAKLGACRSTYSVTFTKL